jgi:hypothetical protein
MKPMLVLLIVASMVLSMVSGVCASEIRYEVTKNGEVEGYLGNSLLFTYTFGQWEPASRDWALTLLSRSSVKDGYPKKVTDNEIENSGVFQRLDYVQFFEIDDNTIYVSSRFSNNTNEDLDWGAFAHGILIPVKLYAGTKVTFAGFEIELTDDPKFRWRDNTTANWCRKMVVGEGTDYAFEWNLSSPGMITMTRQEDYFFIYAMISGKYAAGSLVVRDVNLVAGNK